MKKFGYPILGFIAGYFVSFPISNFIFVSLLKIQNYFYLMWLFAVFSAFLGSYLGFVMTQQQQTKLVYKILLSIVITIAVVMILYTILVLNYIHRT